MPPKTEWVSSPMAIIDNGNVAMWCFIRGTQVEVYEFRYEIPGVEKGSEEYHSLWKDGNFNVYHEAKLGDHVMSFRARRIFIGRCDCPEDKICCGKMREGHGVLCEMEDGTYILISGTCIEKFKTLKDDKITFFVSQVGRNGVPYPYAKSDSYTYFLLDAMAIENSKVPKKKYLYHWYYHKKKERRAARPIPYNNRIVYNAEFP